MSSHFGLNHSHKASPLNAESVENLLIVTGAKEAHSCGICVISTQDNRPCVAKPAAALHPLSVDVRCLLLC